MMRIKLLCGFLSVAAISAGCAHVPRPVPYNWTYQYHMQAAQHWGVLANEVASSPGLQGQTVYVLSEDRVPFDRAYRSFVTTALVSRGVTVVPVKDASTATLTWSTQPIVHYAQRSAPGFPLGWAG